MLVRGVPRAVLGGQGGLPGGSALQVQLKGAGLPEWWELCVRQRERLGGDTAWSVWGTAADGLSC